MTTVALGLGSNPTGTTRRMSDGRLGLLTYEAYQPPDNTPVPPAPTPPPCGAPRGEPVHAGDGAEQRHPHLQRLRAGRGTGQDQPGGQLHDTVLATVNF